MTYQEACSILDACACTVYKDRGVKLYRWNNGVRDMGIGEFRDLPYVDVFYRDYQKWERFTGTDALLLSTRYRTISTETQ